MTQIVATGEKMLRQVKCFGCRNDLWTGKSFRI